MRKSALIIAIITLSSQLYAQKSIDLVTLSGSYGFPQSYENQVAENATEYLGSVSFTLPVVLSDNTVIFNNLNYYYSSVQSEADFGDSISIPINLYGFILRTGISQKIDQNSGFQVLLLPRFMSDFYNVDIESFQLGGIAMYERRFNKDLMMRFGAMYNQEFFGPYLVPIVHIDWDVNSELSVVGMLPVYLKAKYKVNEQLEAGFSFFGFTTTYRLGHPSYQGDYMERLSIDLALYGRYHIMNNIHVEARFGYSASRYYAQYDKDDKVDFSLPLVGVGDDRTQKNVTFNSGPLVNLRLVYSLPLD